MALVTLISDWSCVILFILGFIGNLLGLVVFSSRRLRCCSTYAVLALTSFSINLICVMRYSLVIHSTTRRWLSDNFVGVHWLTCKIYRLSSSFRVIAAWVTVFWVIERFVYVTSRLNLYQRRETFQVLKKHKYLCMIITALIMVIIVTGPTVILFSPSLNSMPNTTQASTRCTFESRYKPSKWQDYFDDISFGLNYHTIRCLFSELIPSLLVAVFNIAIIACILRTTAHVRRRQYSHNNLSMTAISGITTKLPHATPIYLYDRSQQLQTQGSLRQASIKGTASPNTNVPFGKMSWMNVVLLLHSLLFFLSSSITSLVYFTTSDVVLAHLVSVIILANCSLNFYVYCLSGRQFRKELKRIAQRYIRHIRKAFMRNSYSHDRRRSPIQNGKNNIYQPIQPVKPNNYVAARCMKSYHLNKPAR